MRRDCRILLGGVPLFARPAAQSRFCSVVYKALFSELAARVHSGKTVILSSEDAKNRGPGVPPIRRELKNGLRLLVKTQFQRDFSIAPVQHRRAALYPAEPRVLGGSFSRLVGPRQRPARAKGEGARPRRHTFESCRARQKSTCRACRDCGGSILSFIPRKIVHFAPGELPACK
jgi:hypothetical protein